MILPFKHKLQLTLYRSDASCYIKRKKINNEGVDIDGFQSSSLMTAWEEVFLVPWVEEDRKTVVNGCAGI